MSSEKTKTIKIKQADIVIFPNNIDFLQISTKEKPQETINKTNNLKIKEKPQSLLHKPKVSNESLETKVAKVKSEIEQITIKIEKKEEKIAVFQNNQSQKEKDISKITELEQLIAKWRSVGQEAIIELQKHLQSNGQTNEKLQLKDLFRMMNIEDKLFCYNEENDEFDV